MRRKLAAVALAAGMFVAAGCGGDDDDEAGGKSTEEVCDDLQGEIDPMQGDLEAAGQRASDAAAAGDDAALAEAALELNGLFDDVSEALRTGAEEAEDEQFSSDLEASADELDAGVESAAQGEMPDQAAFTQVLDTIGQHCE